MGRRTLLVLTTVAFIALTCTPYSVVAEAADDETSNQPQEEVLVAQIEVVLPSNSKKKRTSSGEDLDERCAEWSAAGECEANPDYMMQNCAGSCSDDDDEDDVDQPAMKGKANVYSGEDAAVGAFRFAENYSTHYKNEMIPTSTVLDIARELQTALNDYTPPQDITHCCGDSNKKARVCSAGKLWKRAEDMRKEDMHDAAGADLIRAMLKTGIEVDFVEKCERSLSWAMGSIRRQREREAREAIEEAKLEKRRLEEEEAMAEALQRKKEYLLHFENFGKGLQESLTNGRFEATINADGTVDEDGATRELLSNVVQSFVATGPQGGNWDATLQLTKKLSPSDKTVDILLIEARCHEMLSNHRQALSSAAKVIGKGAKYEPWSNDSPRMLAATLGANAAMQLGLSENAISVYQNVLKFDPEQDRARKQYRGLKKVVKLLKKAEDEIQKGYNKVASVHVDNCLSALKGLDIDSPLFRSKIQLKQCTILSSMGKHEEALENCDTAVELRLANEEVVSVESRKEALLVRAEALLLDLDYDDAVNDFRTAFHLVDLDTNDRENMQEKQELNQKLRQAEHQQKLWNGGERDQRYNEHTGYPDGRPPERDHAKILQLPIDLEQRSKEVKCAWLKKQFKTLVRHYHPDKYKGNKKRAARKFQEVKDSKDVISKAWNC